MSFEQIIHHLEKKDIYVTLGMSSGLKDYCATTFLWYLVSRTLLVNI